MAVITKTQADLVQLSRSFKASEWFVSVDYPNIAEAMEMPDIYLYKLRVMAATILQPMRDKFGPLTILSGYRSEDLNTAVGGELTSQHRLGEAADITAKGYQSRLLFTAIKDMLPYAFQQLILYLNDEGNSRFIHVSLPCMPNKSSNILVNHKGKYMPWNE